MVEQNENNAVVSDEEINAVTNKILSQDKVEKDKLAKEIEDRVRKEIEQEQKMKDLEEKNKIYEAAIKKKEEEKKTLEEVKNKELEELRKQVGGSKAQINTQNPFRDPNRVNMPNSGKQFAENLTPEKRKEIDENSKAEFLKAMGISEKQWG